MLKLRLLEKLFNETFKKKNSYLLSSLRRNAIKSDCARYNPNAPSSILQVFVPIENGLLKLKWATSEWGRPHRNEGYLVREGVKLYDLYDEKGHSRPVYCPVNGYLFNRLLEPVVLKSCITVCFIQIENGYVDIDPRFISFPFSQELLSGVIQYYVGVGYLVKKGDLLCKIITPKKSIPLYSTIDGVFTNYYKVNGSLAYPQNLILMVKPFNIQALKSYKSKCNYIKDFGGTNLLATVNKAERENVINFDQVTVTTCSFINVSQLLSAISLRRRNIKRFVPRGIEFLAMIVYIAIGVLKKFKTLTYIIGGNKIIPMKDTTIGVGLGSGMRQYNVPIETDINSYEDIVAQLAEYFFLLKYELPVAEAPEECFHISTDLGTGAHYFTSDLSHVTARLHIGAIDQKVVVNDDKTISVAPILTFCFDYDLRLCRALGEGEYFLMEMKKVIEDPFRRLVF